MRITHRQLKKIIKEAFIASADGKIRRIGKDSAEDYQHQYADAIMDRSRSGMDPSIADKLSMIYGPQTGDPDYSKEQSARKQAIELSAGLGGISDKEADIAKFDIDTALDPRYEDFKYDAHSSPADLGLLKSFLNYLNKKGELVVTDPKKTLNDVYDISDMFIKRYPGQGYPDELDYEKLGAELYDGDFYIVGYDEKIGSEYSP